MSDHHRELDADDASVAEVVRVWEAIDRCIPWMSTQPPSPAELSPWGATVNQALRRREMCRDALFETLRECRSVFDYGTPGSSAHRLATRILQALDTFDTA